MNRESKILLAILVVVALIVVVICTKRSGHRVLRRLLGAPRREYLAYPNQKPVLEEDRRVEPGYSLEEWKAGCERHGDRCVGVSVRKDDPGLGIYNFEWDGKTMQPAPGYTFYAPAEVSPPPHWTGWNQFYLYDTKLSYYQDVPAYGVEDLKQYADANETRGFLINNSTGRGALLLERPNSRIPRQTAKGWDTHLRTV